MRAAGQTIGLNDLLIGAHAQALGLMLVTDNLRAFSPIRGLSVENWLERQRMHGLRPRCEDLMRRGAEKGGLGSCAIHPRNRSAH